MKRKIHSAGFAVFTTLLGTLLSVPLAVAAPAGVSGVVRNRAGEPQIGAQVELLRADLSVAATVSTDAKGRFQMSPVLPGRYSLKAICSSYLPTLRENVRVRTGTVVNLTLETLYEALQWLPTQPRKQGAQKDDWMWTLRSAENRPLLRWLEDGPLIVVDEGRGVPKLKARLMATGQEGTFGESGERYSAMVDETPVGSRELLARVDFAPGSDAGMESMLGFRQDLGYTGSVQSVAALSVQPEVGGGTGQGLAEWAVKSWETARLGESIEVEAGSTAVMAQLPGARRAARTLPFANLRWQGGTTSVSYRMSSFVPSRRTSDETEARGWMPAVTLQDGGLAFAHGLHQEIGWERQTEKTGMRVTVFSDHIQNPVLEAATRLADGRTSGLEENNALVDSVGNLLRASGPGFSSSGIAASVERELPAGNRVRLSYANGDALVIPATTSSVSLGTLLRAARPRRAPTYTLALSGTLEGTGTRWRASYRWQPEDTLTTVAPYQLDASAPYMNLHLRQPVRLHREGSASFEFLLDVRNLLAEGYRPYLLNDGSLLLFAQEQRGVRTGVAFTF